MKKKFEKKIKAKIKITNRKLLSQCNNTMI